MKFWFTFLFSLCSSFLFFAQKLDFPRQFLGYEIGQRFTPHHKVVDYFKALSKAFPAQCVVEKYGESYEGRELILVFIGSPETITNRKTIQNSHANFDKKEKTGIVWLSYNVHGNESSGTEAAMLTAYKLISEKQTLLEETLVIIDPCLNPDGRDRYVNFFLQNTTKNPSTEVFTAEHIEPWPSGRYNHYLFDLNRDWAWQTQIETQQRMPHFLAWQPHVHVDFHEQHYEDDYFFPPAAEPMHRCISDWQKQFQNYIGENHSKYFNENGWKFFTKEVYDLLYPSYGDTYPSFNGAVGMTYEQGGSGKAGLAVILSTGDTLSLANRVEHHVVTAISTLEVSVKYREKLIKEQHKYFEKSKSEFSGFLLGDSPNRLDLLTFLDKQSIDYQFVKANQKVKCLDYETGINKTHITVEKDIYVSVNQKYSALTQVLFEPKTYLSDSLTYDVTAWALPYAYNVPACATEKNIEIQELKPLITSNEFKVSSTDLGFFFSWNNFQDAQLLAYLLDKKWKLKLAKESFIVNGKTYEQGSISLLFSDNEDKNKLPLLTELRKNFSVELHPISTYENDNTIFKDSIIWENLGFQKIGLVFGDKTDPLTVGEVWHYFEQQLNYPLKLLKSDNWEEYLPELQTVIFADYKEEDLYSEQLTEFVSNGGKLILLGKNSITSVSKTFSDLDSSLFMSYKTPPDKGVMYNSERGKLVYGINGAIYKCQLNLSSSLTFGIKDYYTQRLSNELLFVSNEAVIKVPKNSKALSGFVGSQVKDFADESVVADVVKFGEGRIVCFADNPLFRAQWWNGKLLFANALFFVK